VTLGKNTPSSLGTDFSTDVINLVISSKGKKLPNNPSLGFGLTLGPKINMWPDAWLRLFRKMQKAAPLPLPVKSCDVGTSTNFFL
jgi:hypothetical protein